jgi:hypothetical protein
MASANAVKVARDLIAAMLGSAEGVKYLTWKSESPEEAGKSLGKMFNALVREMETVMPKAGKRDLD